jgi:hypothetical protein
MATNETSTKRPWGKHRYKSVIEGCAMAAQYRRSGLTLGEFVRQAGVTRRMVEYWSRRERELAARSQGDFVEVTPSQVVPARPAETMTEMTLLAPPSVVPDEPEQASVEPPLSLPLPAQPSLEIRLPGGATIAVGVSFDPVLLRAVVGCLAVPC